jgi:hypothetical protein
LILGWILLAGVRERTLGFRETIADSQNLRSDDADALFQGFSSLSTIANVLHLLYQPYYACEITTLSSTGATACWRTRIT